MDTSEKTSEKTIGSLPAKALEFAANDFLLGADPEFAVVEPPNKTVLNIGPHAVETQEPTGGIGSDHNGRVWELRPAPSRSAWTVVDNIWKLLKGSSMSKVQHFKWKSGALGGTQFQQQLTAIDASGQGVYSNIPVPNGEDTLGGHVHFGLGALNASQKQALCDLTTALLNLEVLPTKENTRRLQLAQSRGLHYGSLTYDSIRACQGHVEFRAAPSWLDRPGQALAALTAYKLAACRPSALTWAKDFELKNGFLEWLEDFSKVDVDAFLLLRTIERLGFGSIQADPETDFKSRWRHDRASAL
jgi:hypothetical protein